METKEGVQDIKQKVFFTTGFLLISLVLLFSVSFASAGIVDWYNSITGRASDSTTSMAVTVGNNAPTIYNVTMFNVSQNPSEGGTRYITVIFNVTDIDGVTNLNDTTAELRFQKATETTRYNTSCVLVGDLNDTSAGYSCLVGMEYWDGSGEWTINATIDDINEARGENSTETFTYNLLTSMVMSPTALTWGSLNVTDTDIGSNNDPIKINNTGNDKALSINVTGYDLAGSEIDTQFIYAHNFTVEATAGCGATTLMSNATSINVTSTILESGNNSIAAGDDSSGQEELYFCLKGLPVDDISAQDYAASGALSWNIQIIT
ncbi:hypothetical protein KAI32_01615 [Candidatus Pacearchaeota archaeon]|nr:hypothetical protein [Candidatus Pacearchaeota archaeon]